MNLRDEFYWFQDGREQAYIVCRLKPYLTGMAATLLQRDHNGHHVASQQVTLESINTQLDELSGLWTRTPEGEQKDWVGHIPSTMDAYFQQGSE